MAYLQYVDDTTLYTFVRFNENIANGMTQAQQRYASSNMILNRGKTVVLNIAFHPRGIDDAVNLQNVSVRLCPYSYSTKFLGFNADR